MQRNPWKGISTWKEFQYDMRHPVLFLKRGHAGMMGRNPEISSGERIVGTVLVAMGILMMLIGVVALAAAYLGGIA